MQAGRAWRSAWLACCLHAGLIGAADAGIFGVPTNLNATGTTSGSSVNPPGWLILSGPSAATAGGDTVHQLRLFIEVTGTSLDVRVFDAGTSGARDFRGGGDYDTTTSYELYDPGGGVIQSISIRNDNGVTDDRLARFASSGTFTAANGGSIFSGLDQGLYELRVRTLGVGGDDDDDYNAFGVELCDGSCEAVPALHYNVYTYGDSDTGSGTAGGSETSLIIGGVHGGGGTSTAPFSDITEPMMFFPYVDRGCSLQTSNFDHDGTGDADSIDLGQTHPQSPTITGLTISANADHDENTVAIESTAAANLEVINYGLWSLANDAGSNFNVIDWRIADFSGWNNNPGALPRDPTNPLRTYLPSGYRSIPGGGCAASERSFGTTWCATLPPLPSLTASTRYVSGANPPVAGATTRFLISATFDNCAVRNATDATLCDVPAAPASGVQLTIPILPASATASYAYVAGSQAGFVNGASAACSDGSAAGFRRCTFASLAAGDAATLNVEVDVTLLAGATGRQVLTGAPAAGAPPPDTTVWGRYTPAFSSASFTRSETRGPLCNLAFTVGTTLATRATLAGLRVDPAGLVEFATASQRGSAAFNVYATRSREAEERVRVAGPIRVRVPDAQAPTLYRVATRPLGEPYLLIEEVDAAGRRRMMGPFAVADARLAEALGRLEARMAQAGAREDGTTRRLTPDAAARWAQSAAPRAGRASAGAPRPLVAAAAPNAVGVKVEIAQAGLVHLPLADLAPFGLPAELDVARLRLTNLGSPVAFTTLTDANGAPVAIEFLAQGLSTDYTGRNVYLLTWRGAPPRLRASLTRSEDPRSEAVRVERNQIYLASAPEGSDPWLWDLLFGDGTPWPYVAGDGSFDIPGLAPGASGPVPVRLRFVGRTAHLHRVEAFINGVPVGAMTFRGATTALLQGSVPAEALLASGNELSVVYQASDASPQELGLVYLNYAEVAAPLVDAPGPASFELAPYEPRLPGFVGFRYLIVTHPAFRDAAERLAALKSGEGYRARVVDVERAYDRFSTGVVEARAIHSLLRTAAAAGVRYVLLLGDDTFDTHDYLGTGAVSFVPSLIGWDGEFGRVPSENLYADLNGDGRPELAIGRLPASTPQEADALVDKVAGQAAGLGAASHLFAVDNQAPGDTPFPDEAAAAAVALPAGAAVAWARVEDGIDAARAALVAGLEAGTAFTHYFGHAGPELWADEALLTVPDVEALAGAGSGGVLFAWACEAQWYLNLTGPAINEALVLRPAGGAVAAFGPAGVTPPDLQRALSQPLYRAFFHQRLPLGEAIRRAKVAALRADPNALPAVVGFNLLGDPALRLPR
jgi:hypothetical protein